MDDDDAGLMAHPETDLEIDIAITLKNDLAEKVIQEAERRGKSPVDLMADVLNIIVNNALWADVLDKPLMRDIAAIAAKYGIKL